MKISRTLSLLVLGVLGMIAGCPQAPVQSSREMAQTLADGFNGYDGDASGALTFIEASSAVSGLARSQFNTMDDDGDGKLTQAELASFLGTDVGEGEGEGEVEGAYHVLLEDERSRLRTLNAAELDSGVIRLTAEAEGLGRFVVADIGADGSIATAELALPALMEGRTESVHRMVPLQGNLYLVAGDFDEGETLSVFARLVNSSGEAQWNHDVTSEGVQRFNDLILLRGGGYVVVTEASLYRLASDGSLLWDYAFEAGVLNVIYRTWEGEDGTFHFTNFNGFVSLSPDGFEITTRVVRNYFRTVRVQAYADGTYIELDQLGGSDHLDPPQFPFQLERHETEESNLWAAVFSTVQFDSHDEPSLLEFSHVYDFFRSSAGEKVFATGPYVSGNYLKCLDYESGVPIWDMQYDRLPTPEVFFETSDGGVFIAGSSNGGHILAPDTGMIAIAKSDANGYIPPLR